MMLPVSDNLKINEETLPVISQLAESIPGGFFIYHAFGDQELIYFNSHLVSIFGCDSDEEFANLTGNSFKGIVHPDDYAISENLIADQIENADNAIDHIKYRFFRKDGSVGVLDDYGHFEHSESFGDIFYVFVQEVTDQYTEDLTKVEDKVDLETSIRMNLERERERNQYIKIVENLANDFECVNCVKVKDGKMVGDTILIRISEKLAKTVPGWATETDAFKRHEMFIEAAVAPEDRDDFRKNADIEKIIPILYQEGVYFVDFKAIIDGEPKYCQLKYSTVIDDDGKVMAIVFGLHNVDKEVRREFELVNREKQAASIVGIANQYASNHDAVMLASLKTGLFRTVSVKDGVSTDAGPITFRDAIVNNVLKYVHEDDKQLFIEKVSDFDAIREKYVIGESHDYEYRCKNMEGEFVWYRITLNRINEEELLIALKECNLEVITRIATQKLLNDYDALYVLNLDKNELRSVRPSRVSVVGEFTGAMDYKAVAMKFADTVLSKYREDWIRFSDVSYLKEYMAHENHREYVYELPGTEKTMRRFSVDAIERIDGEVTSVLLSFMGIDDARADAIRLHRQLAEQGENLKTALEKAEEEILRRNLVYEISDSREWSYIINAYDEVLSVHYSNELLKMANVEDAGEPMSWVDLLHPDDKDRTLSSFMSAIYDHSGKTAYSETYRILGKDGKYRWMRSSGRVIRHDDGTGEYIGMATDFTKEAEEQERQQKLKMQQQAIMDEALKEEAVFIIDCENDTRKTVHDKLAGASNYDDAEKYSSLFGKYVDLFVGDPDREKMKKFASPSYLLGCLGNKDVISVQYRDWTTGIQRFYVMKITRFSDTEVIQSFRENDAEMVDGMLFEKLKENYIVLFVADLDTGLIRSYKEDPLHIIGEEGEVAEYTPTLKNLSSYFEGKTREFFEKVSDIDYIKEKFSKEDRADYQYRSIEKDNNKWVNISGIVFTRHDDGTPSLLGLAFNYLDESSSKLKEQQEQTELALEAARVANKAKTDFLFNMSHDIRTPMNAIIGFTNLAKKHIDDKERVIDSLEKTQTASELLLSLINDILDMSRIESGKINLDENEGDVYLSFANIESTMRELARTKDIRLNFEFSSITDRFVYADFSRCVRIFVNIISNAIKYTNEGGYVNIRCEQIDSKDGFGYYKYTFEDNGIGMSDEFQTRVFDEFSRKETTTVSGIQGTGLGLAVCKSFVTAMNGTIECKSKQGEGSTFTVILPFKIQDGQYYTNPITGQIVLGEISQKEIDNIDFVGKKVLLVEDNDLNREIAEDILSEEGFIIETASDGSVAVKILNEKGPNYYDFILMDIQMPIMNGYEATRAIREMYPKSAIPIIALSANAFEEDKLAALTAGMNDHIAKPIKTDELLSILSKYM